MRTAVYFVPIITTVIALAFAGVVLARWMDRSQPHLLWWGIGLLTYAAGTITESATTLLGWHEPLFRAWYITGALLGGAPSRRAPCISTCRTAWRIGSRSSWAR